MVVDSTTDTDVDTGDLDTGVDAGDLDSGGDTALDSGADVPADSVADSAKSDAGDAGADTTVIDSGTDTAVIDSGTDTAVIDSGPPPVCYAPSWCVVSSGTTATLWGIWASGASDAWAVGNLGTVLRYNGTAWSKLTTPIPATEAIYAVWGTSPTNVYVLANVDADATGKVYRYDGSAWTNVLTMPTGEFLSDLDGTAANDVWAVGPGVARHYNGTAWATVSLASASDPASFNVDKAISPTDNWVLGSNGSIQHWNGSAWSSLSSPTTRPIYPPWAVSASDIYAPLFGGGAIHYNGTSWSSLSTPSSLATTSLLAAWASSASTVWFVGENGTILSGSATSGFTVVSAPDATTKADLNGIFGSSSAQIWAVGNGGKIVQYKP